MKLKSPPGSAACDWRNRVQWTGFTRDVTAELLKMDLLVLPSLFGKGLPMVVLKAMAAGVPVVAPRVAGTAEAVPHGRDGLVVEPGDAGQLAAAIAELVEGRQDWAGCAPARSNVKPPVSPIASWPTRHRRGVQ